jgi:predicted phosphoserine aminotransferase
VNPEVLAAQAQRMLPHRSSEFETIYRRTWEKARQIFMTKCRVYVVTASGTGLQEAAVRNLVKRDVLSCVNGAFSKRWYDVALANGKQAELLETAWNQPITPNLVAEALRQKKYEAITIAHNETSTGVENPIQEVTEAVRETSPETLILVDAVSSAGGVKIEMDAWGLDMVLTSSQKCLALPPGLSLAAVSDRALSYARMVPDRGWYFDLVRMEDHLLKDSTPATPALSLIYALDLQLDRILAEGLDRRFQRHRRMAERVQEWALMRNLELFAPRGYRSKTVTAIDNTRNLDVAAINTYLKGLDMRIANGYGQLKGKTFRIAHMGEIQLEDIEVLLTAMDEYIR